MRGFDNYQQAYRAMTEAIVAAYKRFESQLPMPENRFDCNDRVWWIADDSQGHDLNFCERGFIHMVAPLPFEDSDQWDWQYFIWVDNDSLSGDRLHYCLVWEHELLERAMAHFSSNSSQYVNSGQF